MGKQAVRVTSNPYGLSGTRQNNNSITSVETSGATSVL
ncbi:hypothetical protein GGR92_002026 [Spirosoma lacussanchae]